MQNIFESNDFDDIPYLSTEQVERLVDQRAKILALRHPHKRTCARGFNLYQDALCLAFLDMVRGPKPIASKYNTCNHYQDTYHKTSDTVKRRELIAQSNTSATANRTTTKTEKPATTTPIKPRFPAFIFSDVQQRDHQLHFLDSITDPLSGSLSIAQYVKTATVEEHCSNGSKPPIIATTFMTAANGVTPPSWLPADWSLGSPMPTYDLTQHPKWETTMDKCSSETKGKILSFLDEAGDNARNQLMRPTEYLAQVKYVEEKLSELFDNEGKTIVRRTGGFTQVFLPDGTKPDRLNWFRCAHSNVESHYALSKNLCTFVSIYYMSFVGNDIPPRTAWGETVKAELPNVELQLIEKTAFFSPKDRQGFETLLKGEDPDTVKDMTKYYGTPKNNSDNTINEYSIGETFEGTAAWSAYFSDLFTNAPDHPTLSDRENYAVGFPEMLRREDEDAAKQKNKYASVFTSAEDYAQPTTIDPPTASELYERVNELNAEWLHQYYPRFDTIPCMCTPQGKLALLNSDVFGKRNWEKIWRTWPKSKVAERHYTQSMASASKAISAALPVKLDSTFPIQTYRVTIRTCVTPWHGRDREICAQPPYVNATEFNEYVSSLKRQANQGVKETLITPEDWEYASLVGIKIPLDIKPFTTAQLSAATKKRRRDNLEETALVTSSSKKSKQRQVVQGHLLSNTTNKLTSYFQTITANTTTTTTTTAK